MFRLLRYFSIASGAAVAAITLLFVVVYSNHERTQLVDVEERHNAILARFLANMLLPAYEPYIESVRELDGDALRLRPETKLIDGGVRQAMEGLPVQKIKVYHPSGLTVYSSEASQIGESKTGYAGYELALSSKRPVSKLSFRDSMSAFSGVRTKLDLVESYVPIVDDSGRVRTVFEVYTDVSDQVARSKEETFRFTLLLLFAFGALYAALFMLVRRADRVIAQQYNSLAAFNTDLEKRVTERTAAAEAAVEKARQSTNALTKEVEERRRIEQELRATNADLENATRAKSDFLMTMSHEIRTPLNGVLGMSDILSKTTLSEQQQRLLATVNHSATGLLTIINDILDVAKIEEGQLTLDESNFDLHRCLEEATDHVAEAAHKKGLELTLFVSPDVPQSVTGDAGRLRQAFGNILSNAVKFTEKGQIEINVACVERTAATASIAIKVRDTGIGISPEIKQRLFKPFERADSSMSRRFGGTGLGLAITKHLIETMGGSVDLVSEPGLGSEFTLAISLQLHNSSYGCAPEAKPLENVSVLVLDPHHASRDIIMSYLCDAGAEATSVQTPDAALQAMERARDMARPFSVVLLDMDAPESGGPGAIGMLETTARLWNVAAIRVSSLFDHVEDGRDLLSDDTILLSKPVHRNKLIAAVKEALGKFDQSGTTVHGDAAETTLPGAISPAGVRVLVAEDNPVNQLVAQEYLLALNYSVTVVENGVQAIDAFERECFDVILMDCQMPEMDGLTATRRIRALEAQNGFPPIPIIAVTAHAREEDRRQCLAAGMDAFVSKPYTEVQLTGELKKWIGVKRPVASAHTASNASAIAA